MVRLDLCDDAKIKMSKLPAYYPNRVEQLKPKQLKNRDFRLVFYFVTFPIVTYASTISFETNMHLT